MTVTRRGLGVTATNGDFVAWNNDTVLHYCLGPVQRHTYCTVSHTLYSVTHIVQRHTFTVCTHTHCTVSHLHRVHTNIVQCHTYTVCTQTLYSVTPTPCAHRNCTVSHRHNPYIMSEDARIVNSKLCLKMHV